MAELSDTESLTAICCCHPLAEKENDNLKAEQKQLLLIVFIVEGILVNISTKKP